MKKFLAFGLLFVVCSLIIGLFFLINNWFPLNFTMYFVLCALSMFLCIVLQYRANFKRTTLIIPWLVITIASFLVTVNYLNPNTSHVYSNADANVLALKGVDVKDSIILIGKEKTSSFYDNPDYEGTLTIKPALDGFKKCLMSYDVLDYPIYLISSAGGNDSLVNARFLPSFDKTLSLSQGDSLKCIITIDEVHEIKWFSGFKIREKIDSMAVCLSFVTFGSTKEYKSAFTKIINHSYNLYDVIHNGLTFSPQEEDIVDKLRDVLLIRNLSNSKSSNQEKKFLITYKNQLNDVSLLCDNTLYKPDHSGGTHTLGVTDNLYLGVYNSSTRPLNFSIDDDGILKVRYRFPYLSNFPRSSLDDDYHDGKRKVLAISSSTDRLLESDVKEAFYYDLFENENNQFGFSGSVNYKVSRCDEPFKVDIIDDETSDSKEKNTLLARNKSVWHFSVCDLRKVSPVTDKNVLFVNSTFLFSIISFLCLFVFLVSQFCYNSKYKAGVVFGIWAFIIPIIVFRLYLLWRIAVFPPVNDITYNVFQRYRMENGGIDNAMIITLISLFLLIVFTLISIIFENKVLLKFSWANKTVFKKTNWFGIIFCGCWLTSLALLPTGVIGNIAAPVLFFIVCEYISLKGLDYKWRVANILIAFAFLCKGDPGYAIMFFIFACVYYIIHLYAYLKSIAGLLVGKAIAYVIWLSLFAILVLVIIFSPQIVAYAYDDTTQLFIGLTPSKLVFIFIALLTCSYLFLYFWFNGKKRRALLSIISLPFFAFIFIIVGSYILEEEPHFKYRSLVHTEPVSDIMSREDIDNRNSTRLLEASQNQWFIQYHNNRGDKRILDNGIFSLSQHFKKGVSWNTQISDVIISRYVVGEISSILPGAIVFFALCFLILVFRARNASVARRSVCYAIALLLVIQMTFVWMAATNRMIFFGQDFPFLSQNARITMLMFVVLLGIMMLATCPTQVDFEKAHILSNGLDFFAENKKYIFVTAYFCVFVFVGLFGNKYSSIYSEEDGGDSNNASEYNLARMMNRCQADLSLINARLSESSLPTRTLYNDKPVSSLMDSIDADVALTTYVQELRERNEISKFTLSMYNAFRRNLQRRNSISNIIHLKQNSSQTHYELALNNGFYSLKNPDYDNLAWKEDIYSENVRHSYDKTFKSRKNGLVIYGVPLSWLPNGYHVGIVDGTDVNSHTIQQERRLHTEHADYNVNIPIYPIFAGDVLEVHSKKDKRTISFRYGISQENILVKNMIINGKRRCFYPLKEKCFWLKDFSELASFCLDTNSDSTIITLDKNLSLMVYDELAKTGKVSSVIAMDGMGNVRLMADFRGKRYMLDPNDEEDISERVVYSYLNPNPKEELSLFGNMNLCLMNPGPGSSLKPITYAAVTSQVSSFPWETLRLMNANPRNYNDTTVMRLIYEKGKYYSLLYRYGPTYKYRRPFRSLYGDEIGDGTWVNNIFYLSKSSNYYNALITYLGHYGDLPSDPCSSSLFRIANMSDYPQFTLSTSNTAYTFQHAPEEKGNRERSSILLRGLYNNFSMPVYLSEADSLRYKFLSVDFAHTKEVSVSKLASLFPWVYPQASSILDYKLNEHTAPERLRQYTLGSYPLSITPLKMAEMYGKLYSLHPDYHASIIPNNRQFSEKWRNSDGEYEQAIYNFYQRNLFMGMKDCVQNGTAKVHLQNLPTQYYYYAKTGTLLGTNAKHDDRMLAVIIAKQPVETIANPDELKFYVVYFRYKQSGDMPKVRDIVKHIVESESFNFYMQN